MSIVCGMITGPSIIFNIPYKKVAPTVVGWVLQGFVGGIVYLTCVPEMLERMQVDFDISIDNEVLYGKLNDKVNDLFGLTEALSGFVSPLIGEAIFDAIEHSDEERAFSGTYDIVGLLLLVFTAFIFIFNCGIYFISENRTFHKRIALLLEPTKELEKPPELKRPDSAAQGS